MTDMTESPKLLSSIIKELQDNNHINELIFDSVDTLNASMLNTAVSTNTQVDNNDIFLNLLKSVNRIHKGVFKFLDIFGGNDLQNEENRRELLGVLRGIGKEKPKNTVNASRKKEKENGLSDFLPRLLIGGAGFLIGAVSGFISQLSSMILGVLKDSKIYKVLSDFITGIKTGMSNFFLKIKDFFNIRLSRLQAILNNSKIISGITSRISAFFTPVIDLFKYVHNSLSTGPSMFSKLMRPLKSMIETLKAARSTFSGAFRVGKMFGNLLAKLAWPLTIIMGLWDTVTGAMAGYKEDGIKGAIKGGVSGLLNGLVGGILDMVKGGISWIAGALGFKHVEKLLDSFSFSGIITNLVTGITDFLSSIFNLVLAPFTTIPKMIKKAVAAISVNGFKGVFEFPKIVLRETLPHPDKHPSGYDPLHWAARAIPDSVYEYAGIKKPASKENIVSETITAISEANKSQDRAKESADNLKTALSYDTDKDGVFSDAEFITYLRGTKKIGEMRDMKLDYSTPESSKISDELLKASNAISGERISMPQIGGTGISTPPGQPTSQIERTQNNTGSTLNQSSQTTLAMPIIVNNYGGNITNNSTSRVNNTQAIYDPIITGSSLQMA